jgi:hypothetical protein
MRLTISLGMRLTNRLRMRLTVSLRMRVTACLRKGPANRLRKGPANRVYLLDERRRPGQVVAEVKQGVEGHGDHPRDEHDDRLVERLL